MEKEKQYRELIADVKRFYENEARLHQHEPLYLGWYDGCEEINLWTYWQGRGCLDARIMLVGQDWGSPGECSESYMAQFVEFNCGRRSAYWMDGTSITDKNLIALFSSLGYDVSNGALPNPDLFLQTSYSATGTRAFPADSSSAGSGRTRTSSAALRRLLSRKSSSAWGETLFTA